ncbi:MAG: T9SS type A sorting domain-containing protein [Bacteroidetes bacterium]|nr:MAG: T9SS type A sorting domain-containing protein [Bacteroidota bacterium]
MKKLLLLLFAFLFISSAQATHLMGGQITAQQISGNNYEIKLTLFRDTTGIPMYSTAIFKIADVATSIQQSITIGHTGAQAFFNGVEVYDYILNYTFPAAGQYRISWSDCCRNDTILNMSNPGGESLYLSTVLTVDSLSSNSSPVLLNQPVTLAQKNTLYTYNPLPFDADGDSMAWSLDIPLSMAGDTVVGYTLPQGAASNPFTLNNITGEITWMPDSNGHWVASFLVEEFRAGIKIGEIRRDMQIIVVDDTTNFHQMVINTGSWPQDANGNFSITLAPNVPFTMDIQATQGDNDQMDMLVQGEPFILSGNQAQFTIVNNVPGSINGTISWTPSTAQMRTAPYFVVVRGLEFHNNYVLTHDRTIMFRVGTTTGIAENTIISETQLYPNPASQEMFVSFNLKSASTVAMEIYDLSGRLVHHTPDNFKAAGMHLISQNISSLSSGYYTVKLLLDSKESKTLPLIVR